MVKLFFFLEFWTANLSGCLDLGLVSCFLAPQITFNLFFVGVGFPTKKDKEPKKVNHFFW